MASMASTDSLLHEAERCVRDRRYAAARRLLSPAMDSLREKEDPASLCHALLLVGTCQFELGVIPEAKKLFAEGLEVATRNRCDQWIPTFLHELSLVAYKEGELTDSISFCERSIDMSIDIAFVEIGQGITDGYVDYDLNQLGGALNHLCVLYQEAGNYEKALSILNMLRANCERTSNIDLLGVVLHELALASFAVGRYTEGAQFFVDSIREKKKVGNFAGINNSLRSLQTCLLKYPDSLKDSEVLNFLKAYTS